MVKMCSVDTKPVFRDLTADDPDPEITEIESLCMNCHANGMTRLLLTRIPYFKNVVLMSFSCEECGYENNEIQPGGAIAEMGIRWTLHVECQQDLNRQIVKSDYTSVKIPEVDLEIPAQSQKGEVTTLEGIIGRAISGLTQDQSSRKAEHPEAAAQIEEYIAKLQLLKTLSSGKFTVMLEDISGNCFVENPEAPKKDPRCTKTEFKRNKDENHQLGIFTHEEVSDEPSPKPPLVSDGLLVAADPKKHTYDQMEADEIMNFNTNCPDCNAVAETHMKLTKIPHFKEVVIMATNCDSCGHRTNEVKSGGGIEEKGIKFELRVASREDFSRDVLKSETCSMSIPELDLEVGGQALGGRFTTAEGLLRATADQLSEAPGVMGDAPSIAAGQIDKFLLRIKDVLECKLPVTIVLDDPAGNSYVQSLNDDDPSKPDDGLKILHYERSFEQNEELGINDMKTEGYENDS